ncbi:hypothetical protein L6164_004439 [Bauhinia variegata]|uniref:Uncharacterized protein n=1 Tax=Bauhinia variegata TaxID=167791 RepID=A0ACB9Q4F4_BAUVA|nr:hypothetical protein L6164_004439 [Bauhinia variegata]
MGSLTVTANSQPPVPVINFTLENMKPYTDAWVLACQEVKSALEDHGCFYALWDKVPVELYNSVFTLMEELFDLPLETKKQETSDKPYHSYYGETAFLPLYESLGIDDPLTIEGVKKFTKIMWPAGYDHFWYCTSISSSSFFVRRGGFAYTGLFF